MDDELPDFDAVIPLDALAEVVPASVPSSEGVGRPLWILRGDRVPQKVESKEKRKKVEIPPDSTHWAHEGDVEWIPFSRARPAEVGPVSRQEGTNKK